MADNDGETLPEYDSLPPPYSGDGPPPPGSSSLEPPAASSAAPPPPSDEGGEEGGWLAKIQTTVVGAASTVSATTKRTLGAMGMAMGMTYSAKSYAEAFGVEPGTPLLGAFPTYLLSGTSVIAGQYYVTPREVCVYTHANKKIVKVVIPYASIVRAEYVVCVNLAEMSGSSPPPPVFVPPGTTEPDVSSVRANTVNLYTAEGPIHTFIGGKGPFLIGLSLVYAALAKANPTAAAASPYLPRVALRLHTEYSLPSSEFILRSFRGAVLSGEDILPTTFHVWERFLTFTVHDTPVVIPLGDVVSLSPARSVKSPDPESKATLLIDVPLDNATAEELGTTTSLVAPPQEAPAPKKKKSRFGSIAKGLAAKASALAALTPIGGPPADATPEQLAKGKPPNAIQVYMNAGVKHQMLKIDFLSVYNVLAYAWSSTQSQGVEYYNPL